MLSTYSTHIFDCDGVVLNSNTVKTDAFRAVTLRFGEAASSALLDFHIRHGGVSRYAKFRHFVDTILPAHAPHADVGDTLALVSVLLSQFGDQVKAELLRCELASGLAELRDATPDASWMIVSGGDQAELREVFEERGLDHYFDGGIYGSPKDKHTIVLDLLETGHIQRPALFLGDSRLDHEVAKAFDLDFVFVSQWTEFEGWEEYCSDNQVPAFEGITQLLRPRHTSKQHD